MTFLRVHAIANPARGEIGRIIHEADLADERLDDDAVLEATGALFDGLHAFKQRAQMLGREVSLIGGTTP